MITRTITFAVLICCICFSNAKAAIVIDPGSQAVFEYDFSADIARPKFITAELSVSFFPRLNGTMEVEVLDDLGGSLFGTRREGGGQFVSLLQTFTALSVNNVRGSVVVRNITGDVSVGLVRLKFFSENGLQTQRQILSPITTPVPAALPLAATAFVALGYVARRRRKAASAD